MLSYNFAYSPYNIIFIEKMVPVWSVRYINNFVQKVLFPFLPTDLIPGRG
jgi:hypothetical protein